MREKVFGELIALSMKLLSRTIIHSLMSIGWLRFVVLHL